MNDGEIPNVSSEEELEMLELIDQAETVGKLSPREYAQARGMTPQLVYYYIRTGKVKKERCVCGRWVIDVRAADEAIQTKAAERGAVLDTRPDDARGSQT
jgi:hypothetical protein